MIVENISAPVTLVLHHPHFFSAEYWKGWSELTGCDIIAFDAPFHGENRVDQSYQDFAADTVAQARDLVDTPLVVAGVSQGGVIAQESSGQPGVVGVVGISTTRRAADDEERAMMNGTIDIWGTDGGPQPVAENIAADSANSEQPAYDETVAAVLAMTGEQVSHTIPLLEDRRGGIELSTPYLFIHGTADQTYAFEDMTEDIPAEHLVAVENGSHSMTRNSSEVVAKALREFALSLV
ncbi:MAG TPA: alpha/beta hydrolase [Candidatus Corynebacterium avicola]|uniref:Alpha/beta hydrolase n=1 Tax=Candidatus Corynebacterium avicola TaxID=2838527 RepID=A0A9D1RQ23_9CORY|nr:alpha/beta hydrolase [Candidatus Corynebacterium avicola]